MDQKTANLFLHSNIPIEDQEKIYQWLVDHKTEHESNALLKNLWESVDKTKTNLAVDMDETYNQILRKIEAEKTKELTDTTAETTVKRTKLFRLGTSFLKYAAVIVFAFGLAYFALWSQGKDSDIQQATVFIEKSTSRGQKSYIVLKDGSKVTINAESKILFDKEFGITNRDITLEGEAYFEVAKNKDLPFNVTVNSITTTALGTSFNINAYEDEPYLAISLVSGKVEVVNKKNKKDSDNEKVFLEPGQVYRASNAEDQITEVIPFDNKRVVAWKDNILYFDNTEMKELISEVERWYDVKIIVVNPNRMAGIQGTGQFDNESLENVLRVLSYSLKFDYERDGNQVEIEFN